MTPPANQPPPTSQLSERGGKQFRDALLWLQKKAEESSDTMETFELCRITELRVNVTDVYPEGVKRIPVRKMSQYTKCTHLIALINTNIQC